MRGNFTDSGYFSDWLYNGVTLCLIHQTPHCKRSRLYIVPAVQVGIMTNGLFEDLPLYSL